MLNFKSIVVLMLGTLLASGGWAQNGVSIFEYPLSTDPTDGNMYVSCLGEGVGIDATVTDRFQLLVTPSGKFHVVSNWTIAGMATGQFSGDEWYVHGTSPFAINTNGGQYAETVHVNLLFEPLGDAPKLKSFEDIRLHTDADGNVLVVVLQVKWNCLGRN